MDSNALLEIAQRRLDEQSIRRGQLVTILIAGEEDLLAAWIADVRSQAGEPEVEVFTAVPHFPGFVLERHVYVDAWHSTPAGPRLAVRVGATAYVLEPVVAED